MKLLYSGHFVIDLLPVTRVDAKAATSTRTSRLRIAALPDFQPDILLFPTRVAMFTVRYTMSICLLQLGAFWIRYLLRKPWRPERTAWS